jgi:hypothetical protein
MFVDLFQFGNTLFFENKKDKFKIDVLKISSTNFTKGSLSKWSDVSGWVFVCESDIEGDDEKARSITVKMLKECASQFLTPIQDDYCDGYEEDEYEEEWEDEDDDDDYVEEQERYYESMMNEEYNDEDDDEDIPF